jgi:hypothetical protein
MEAGTTGVRRPTSSGSDLPMVMTRAIEASHAHRLAVSAVMAPPSPNSHRKPERPSSTSKSTMMVTWGPLTRHLRPVRRIQPLTADLAQGIGPSLGERSAVGPRLALFGIEHASERGDQDLAGLGIEVAVHSDHALESGGDV